MKSLFPIRSRRRRSVAPSTLGTSRIEVCPPSLRHAPASLGERIVFWLTAPSPLDAAPPPSRLPSVRRDFEECLDGLRPDERAALARRIAQARTLRDLWHLRPEVYRQVSLQCGQAVAEDRLARVNRHFSTRTARTARSARSALGTLA